MPTPSDPSVRTILCFGDSLTASGIWLKKLEQAGPHQFVNGGRSGRKAADAPKELPAVLAEHPEADSLLLFLGVNDLPARDPRPGEVKVAGCVQSMEAAIDAALERFSRRDILLVAPPTVMADGLSEVNLRKGYDATPSLLADLESAYRDLAGRKGLRFASLLKAVRAEHYRDGLHPTEAGYNDIARALAPHLHAWPREGVFVIGDSISINYHEDLEQLAEGNYSYARKGGLEEAESNLDIARGANGGDSGAVLAYLREVLPAGAIDAPWILVNCGLHDIKTDPATGTRQVPLEQYRKNLYTIVETVHEARKRMVWITTTPVDEARHQHHSTSFHRYEADLASYNAVANEVMERHGVPVIDLYGFTRELMGQGEVFRDHVHFTPEVSAQQARTIHEWLMAAFARGEAGPAPLAAHQPIRGWNILSNSLEDGLRVVERASAYGINHLQLSHQITHDLQHILDPDRREVAERLTAAAHRAGIQEVVLWDRVFYQLDYYPERFRTGPRGTLNLDDAAFWEWLKADYRRLLDAAPHIQGIVLTFIETRTRIEKQTSQLLETDHDKIAAVVNALADVIIGERGLNLYARTFSYDRGEYANITKAVKLFERPEIRLMLKETPHDFFLTHPNNPHVAGSPRPVLIEFDAAGEFNGQGLIANTWPQYMLRRWNEFLQYDCVAGYVARTDRYGKTRMIDRPSEINLLALKRGFEQHGITAGMIYREFIDEHYGPASYPHLRKAFGNAYDIVTSTLYTLGTNVANHSALNYDPYVSSYARHVSGKWIDPPFVDVGHGVDRRFHYWKDVIEHIAPAWAKAGGAHLHEVPRVVEAGWLTPEEQMDEQWLRYILTEKDHGVRLAGESLEAVQAAKEHLPEQAFTALQHHFTHTLLTARLYRATAAAYWGSRVTARGDTFRTAYVMEQTRAGLAAIPDLAEAIRTYPVKPPSGGQWNWVQDADQANVYLREKAPSLDSMRGD